MRDRFVAAVAAIVAAPAAQGAKPPSAEDAEGFGVALAEVASMHAPPDKQASVAKDAKAGGEGAARAPANPARVASNDGPAANAKGADAGGETKRANSANAAGRKHDGSRNADAEKSDDAGPKEVAKSGDERAGGAIANAGAVPPSGVNGAPLTSMAQIQPPPIVAAPIAAAPIAAFPATGNPAADAAAPGAQQSVATGATQAASAPPTAVAGTAWPIASAAVIAAPGVTSDAFAPSIAANPEQTLRAPVEAMSPVEAAQAPAAAQQQTTQTSLGRAPAFPVTQTGDGRTATTPKISNAAQAASAARAAVTVQAPPAPGPAPKSANGRSDAAQAQPARLGRSVAASAPAQEAAAKSAPQSASSVASGGAAAGRRAIYAPIRIAIEPAKAPARDVTTGPGGAIGPAQTAERTVAPQDVRIALRIAPAQADAAANTGETAPRDAGRSGSNIAGKLSDPFAYGSDAPQATTDLDAKTKNDTLSNNADARSAGLASPQGGTDSAGAPAPQDGPAGQAVQPVQHPAAQPQTIHQAQSQIAALAAPADGASGSAPAPAQVAAAHPGGGEPQTRAEVPAIAAAVSARALAGLKTFEIRLDPPELGRIEVHLTVDDDGQARAQLTADHPATLALLARDSQHLERALKDAGLQLSNNSLNFSLKGEGRQGDGGGGFTARARSLPVATVAKSDVALVSAIGVGSAQGNARLDIRV